MLDPISAQATGATGATGQAGGAQPAAGPGQAKTEDVTRFNDSMQSQQQTPQAGQGFRPEQVGQADKAGSPGKVMDGLDKMSADLREMRLDTIADTEKLGDMGNLIRAQFKVANLTMTQTMMGQAGQKSSQGMQQLLKGQ
jgi:hypothetical protein